MPITVYFDGRCGLCGREIAYYRRLDKMHILKWVDVTTHSEALKAVNISQADALLYLHVQDRLGQWYIGVDAFIKIWRNLPYWRMVGALASLPPIKILLEYMYEPFARWRYRKMGYCGLGEECE